MINKTKNPILSFFVKVFSFILILAISDIILGNILSRLFFMQTDGAYFRTTYSIQNTSQEILIFGSSRATYHYNPQIIEKAFNSSCYNVGKNASTILYQYAILKSVLKRYTPKSIILDLNIGEFEYLESDYEKLSSLLPYYYTNPELKDVINLRSKFEKYKVLSNVYLYNSTLYSILRENEFLNGNKKEDINGFLPLSIKYNYPIDTLNIKPKQHIDSTKLHFFENFIKDCKKRGISLYLVISPYYRIIIGQDKSVSIINEFSQRYNIPFFNLSQESTFYDNNLYKDPLHLNVNGAEIFTKRICDLIIYNK